MNFHQSNDWRCNTHHSDHSDDSDQEEENDRCRQWMEEDEMDDYTIIWSICKKKRNTEKRPGGSNSLGRPKYWDSVWGRMLLHPDLQISSSPMRKTFMRRFRVPYLMFKRLVNWTKDWHEMSTTDAAHRLRAPTELKVLGWLRIVGRSVGFDDIEELCHISVPTLHSFFHEFSKKCREKLYPEHVRMPSNVVELINIESAYVALGIPGACGSMDVVHIALGRCPYGLQNVCTGKEGYPTLGYNIICDHQGRALAVMPGAYGTINDKTMVKSDEVVEKVKTEPLFTEYMYHLRKPNNALFATKGAYLIVDGGYLRWKCLQCGLNSSSDENYVEWRRKMESVQKDIECYFGRLKQRFKVLKTPIMIRNKERIDNMMFALVAIQNMILDYSIAAEEITSWEVQLNWQKISEKNEQSYEEIMKSLELAEKEDLSEENDPMWYRPKVKKSEEEQQMDNT